MPAVTFLGRSDKVMSVWSVYQLTLLLIIYPHCSAQLNKTKIVVGAWRPGTEEALLVALRPLFEDYLTAQVGQLYNPTVLFSLIPVDYGNSTDSDTFIGTGQLDMICKCFAATSSSTWIKQAVFADTIDGVAACVEVQHGWSTIATERITVNGLEAGSDGSVIFTLQTNQDIFNISDIKDKRVGVGYILSATTYHLAYQVSRGPSWTDVFKSISCESDNPKQALIAENIDIVKDTAQVAPSR